MIQYDDEAIEFGNGSTIKSKRNFRVEEVSLLQALKPRGLKKSPMALLPALPTPGTQVTFRPDFDTQVVDGFTANVPVELTPTVTSNLLERSKFSAAPSH